jgi:sugar O-acyltransferase (sialic acid O-acetyltransferase NeuD family)
MRKIIIIGAGTGALEVQGIIDDINLIIPSYEVLGVLDDNADCHGGDINGMPVLGDLKEAEKFQDVRFIFAIGSLKTQHIRMKIMSRLNLSPTQFETIIHPTALINKSVKIGAGCIIHPRVTIANNVCLGDFVITAVASTVGPYAEVGDYSMITSHVLVLSNCKIGKSVFIASSTCITENVTIGDFSRIGVGSVVGRNINSGIFAMGNPLRLLGAS